MLPQERRTEVPGRRGFKDSLYIKKTPCNANGKLPFLCAKWGGGLSAKKINNSKPVVYRGE